MLGAIFYKFEILSLQKDLLVNSWDNVEVNEVVFSLTFKTFF